MQNRTAPLNVALIFIQDTSDFIHKICGNPGNNADAMQWKARKLLYIIIKIIIVISRFPLLYVNCLKITEHTDTWHSLGHLLKQCLLINKLQWVFTIRGLVL